jgi:hypothetical protein
MVGKAKAFMEANKLGDEKSRKFSWASLFDWDALSRGCDGQLTHTEKLIDDPEFGNKLDKVIAAARAKLAPG